MASFILFPGGTQIRKKEGAKDEHGGAEIGDSEKQREPSEARGDPKDQSFRAKCAN